jgi:RNA polymerase sigma-70 factor (ECF subfamily)
MAEDVSQQVLLRVHRSLDGYAPESKFTTWVYRITRNVLIDHRRAENRQRSLKDSLRLQQLVRSVMARSDTPGRMSEASSLLEHLMRLLTPQQRAAFDLVLVQGFSTADAAAMLEVSPATIRVHLHRARSALRKQGRHELFNEGPAYG